MIQVLVQLIPTLALARVGIPLDVTVQWFEAISAATTFWLYRHLKLTDA